MSYCTRADIDSQYGTSNVSTWADLENKQSPQLIAARVATAISESEDYINNYLRNGPYTIPFTVIPIAIKNICAALAGLWLYESRGVVETNPLTGYIIHRYNLKEKRTKSNLWNIKSGGLKLDLDSEISSAPEIVVTETDDPSNARSWEDGIEAT